MVDFHFTKSGSLNRGLVKMIALMTNDNNFVNNDERNNFDEYKRAIKVLFIYFIAFLCASPRSQEVNIFCTILKRKVAPYFFLL